MDGRWIRVFTGGAASIAARLAVPPSPCVHPHPAPQPAQAFPADSAPGLGSAGAAGAAACIQAAGAGRQVWRAGALLKQQGRQPHCRALRSRSPANPWAVLRVCCWCNLCRHLPSVSHPFSPAGVQRAGDYHSRRAGGCAAAPPGECIWREGRTVAVRSSTWSDRCAGSAGGAAGLDRSCGAPSTCFPCRLLRHLSSTAPDPASHTCSLPQTTRCRSARCPRASTVAR